MNKKNNGYFKFVKIVHKLKTRDKNDLLEIKNREILKIKKYAENGRVLIVYGGRDCDGSQSDGYTELLDAGYYSTQKFIDNLYEGADGPIWYEYAKPSDAENITVETRDLALEAYENGHNHIIYA